MLTQLEKIMKTLTHNKREFEVVETEPIANYPNLATARPDAKSFFIAVGKKGACISGFILNNNSYIVF